MLIPWISKIKNSKKKTVKTAIVFISVFFFCLTFFNSQVLAQSDVNTFEGGIEVVDQNIALAGTDIRIIVSRIINVFLGLLGIIDLSLMIYAGYIWMTSGGDEGKITEAKATLRNAVIGLIIILSAFAIVSFLFSVLDGRSGGVDDRNRMTNNTFYGSGALGSVIKDHYPMRDQKDVPRNTSIVVTFALPVESSSFIVNSNNSCYDGSGNSTTTCDFDTGSDPYYGDCIDLDSDGIFDYTTECDRVNTSSIKIINLAENPDLESRDYFGFENPAEAVVFPSFEDGNQRNIYTIVIRPLDYLGSPMENQDFSVYLSEDILQKNSTDSIFVDQYAKYYYWDFETGTELDLTPPEVISINPKQDNTISKNEVLQINFSEPVDPTTVSGDYSDSEEFSFNNILVNRKGVLNEIGKVVPGKWQITNGYRTIEFISNEPCGQNSCGDMMYCLPVDCNDTEPKCSNSYEVLVSTAQSAGNAENVFEAFPFTGVYDLALNTLNNISNDTDESLVYSHPGEFGATKIINSGQRQVDNYWWSFFVKNEIDRSRPYVKNILPGVDAQNLDEDQEIKIIFSKIMRYNSLPDSIALKEYPEHVCADAAIDTSTPNICANDEKLDSLWFVPRSNNLDTDQGVLTQTNILHRKLGPNQLDLYYFPIVSSTVQSINQNCLYPGYGPDEENCTVIFNEETGVVSSTTNCILVDENSASSTACAYTNGSGVLGSDVIQSNVSSCLTVLEDNSLSQY